jgi:hypothetical protein
VTASTGDRWPAEVVEAAAESKAQVEATFNKRTPDRWTFDVVDDLGVVCSVPAAGRDDTDAQQTAARIAAALAVVPPDPTADTVLLDQIRELFTDTEVHSAVLMQRVVNVLAGDHPEAFITQIESDRQQVRNLVGDWFDDYNLADRFIGDLDRAGFQIERKADAIAALLAGGGE